MSRHAACDRCRMPTAVNQNGAELICDRCYDAEACCNAPASSGYAIGCPDGAVIPVDGGQVADGVLIGGSRLTVWWSEVNYDLALFLTIEDLGADLKEWVIEFGRGHLTEEEREELANTPDKDVPLWLADADVEDLSWGENSIILPEGWTLTRTVTR